jgi:hypothetical protein
MQQAVNQGKTVVRCILAALVALAATTAAAAAAADQSVDARTASARSLFRAEFGVSGGSSPAPADGGATAAEGSARLEAQRGGTDTHNDMNLNGSVAGNSAVNVVTGNNTIDAGSFANMSGIPVVIQNSGANVLIQNATIINLQMK